MTGPLDRRTLLLGAGAVIAGAATIGGAAATPSYDNPDDMYEALRQQPGETLTFGASEIRLVFADGAPNVDRDAVRSWVRDAATATIAYFGQYPVRRHGVLVIAEPGAKVGHATTFGHEGSATRIHVGTGATRQAFRKDWILVHEIVHTALPDQPRRALWLQEGNATYVEPIARALSGQLSAEAVWRDSVVGMPKGAPVHSDTGLDGTSEWGRLYWGGATFWLLAEIAIYRDTGGRHSLRDAMRRINRESGGNTADWSPEQTMSVGDAAVGSRTLRTLYTRFAERGFDGDLGAVFRQLGVVTDGQGRIRFDDHAPLAELRRRITRL